MSIVRVAGQAPVARSTSAESRELVTAPQPTDASSSPLPAGVLVRADPDSIRRHFLRLAPLQPVRHTPQGLLCAPRVAPESARVAMARCPLILEPAAQVPGWPDPPADAVAGWYRRSPDHAPAPAGVRELIQVPGDGFGALGHATTAMCLAHLDLMPEGSALDAGCGSGLLGQAWAASGRGAVCGYDLDARALDQAARSRDAAGLTALVRLHRAPLQSLPAAALAGRIVLANIPAPAHRALLERLSAAGPPPGAVISGLRPGEAGEVLSAYRAIGLRTVRVSYGDGFCGAALVRG
jgi:ribosomal protein L11 methyltransferase